MLLYYVWKSVECWFDESAKSLYLPLVHRISTYICIYVYICIYILYTYVYIYIIYICIYIYILYKYIYIYIYIIIHIINYISYKCNINVYKCAKYAEKMYYLRYYLYICFAISYLLLLFFFYHTDKKIYNR